MANRFHAAAKRGVSRRAANRRVQFAAAVTLAAATAAGSVFGSEVSRAGGELAGREPSRVEQALGGRVTSDPAVIQTAGGLFDHLFGSSPAPAKSAKDDNRKAYPLPPADPSTVNWSGVPYHTPRPGAHELGASGAVEPIRDVNGRSRPDRSAPPADERTVGSSIMQSQSQPAPRGVPQPPPLARGEKTRTPKSPPTALPAVPPRLTATPELSTESSSRRSGRRAIDPLTLDRNPDLEAAQKVEVMPPAQIVTAVPRRSTERSPIRTEADETTPSARPRELPEEAPSVTAAAPQDASVGGETGDDAWTAADKSLAERRRSGTPVSGISVKIDDSSSRLNDELAAPSPVSRTATTPEAGLSVEYPAGTIASQLSPLRPVHSSASEAESIERADAAEKKPAAKSDLVGSGLAQSAPAGSDADSDSKADGDTEKQEGFFSARRAASGPLSEPKKSDEATARGNSTAEPGPTTAQAGRPEQLAASEQPGIRVTTEGPAEILIRELTQYEIRVENRGDFDATGVVVNTGLPTWAEIKGHNASTGTVVPGSGDAEGRLQWTIDSLPAGVIERMFVRLKPARSGAFEVATNWTTTPQGHAAKVTVREPKLAVTIDGPDRVGVGEPGKYRVTVRNPGDAAASNVRFTLASEAGEAVDKPLGSIAAGKETTFEIEITPGDPTPLTLRGSATADLDVVASAKKAVAVAGAELEATLAGPAAGFHKTQANYQLKLVNVGPVKATAVECEVELPAGMKYVGGIEGATAKGNRVNWTVTELPAGETQEFAFDCRLEGTGAQALSVRFNGKSGGRGEVRLETAVESIVDLKLAVVDPPAPAPVGGEVIYEVIINNRGSKPAEDVRVVAQFGHGIEPIRAEGHPGEVVTGQVLFDRIPRIEPQSQLKLRIVAVAETPGDHRFRAEVRCGESLLVAEEATVFVPRIDERISRSSSDSAAR